MLNSLLVAGHLDFSSLLPFSAPVQEHACNLLRCARCEARAGALEEIGDVPLIIRHRQDWPSRAKIIKELARQYPFLPRHGQQQEDRTSLLNGGNLLVGNQWRASER